MSRSYLPTPQPVIDAGHIEQLRQRIAELEAQIRRMGKAWKDERDQLNAQLAEAGAEIETMRTTLESQGRDHTLPCNLGTFCPWCRIAELEQAGHATLLREVEKDKRIAELEAECKENGTALNRTLLALRDAQAEIKRLREVCVEFEHHASEERIQQSNRNAEHHEKTMKQAIKWKNTAELYQLRIQAMYEALVASGSINRIPEAHEWVGK